MNPWVSDGILGRLYLLARELLTGEGDPRTDLAFHLTCQAESFTDLQNTLPNEPGVYAWYVDDVPQCLDVRTCFQNGRWTLLYVGKARSLRTRVIGDHFKGSDATQSGAIRETIGVLRRFTLFRRGPDVWTFGKAREKELSGWLRDHSRVAWASVRNQFLRWPGTDSDEEMIAMAEKRLVDKSFDLPLNRDQKRRAVCQAALQAWKAAKELAKEIGDEEP